MENKQQQLKKLKNERGLTLVELLAVIVILGIISTIAFVMIGNVIDNSKKDAHIANAQQLIASAKLYEATGDQLNATNGVSASELHEDGYIEKIVDPWEKEELSDENMKASTVTKDTDGNYTVTLKAHDAKHEINNVSESNLRTNDRDDNFGSSSN